MLNIEPYKQEKKNNDKEANFFDIAIGCMGMGVVNNVFGFMSPSITLLCYLSGIGSVVIHMHDKHNAIRQFWEKLGFKDKSDQPKLRQKIKTDYGYCFRFSIPSGKGIKDYEKNKDAIHAFFDKKYGCDRLNIKYSKGANLLFEMYQKNLEKEYIYEDNIETKGDLEIPLGYSFGEKLVTIDLLNAIHVLVAGETGAGKSTLIRLIITYLLAYKDVMMTLLDFKFGTEFGMFDNHEKVEKVVVDKQECYEVLLKAQNEMMERGQLFYQKGVKDIFDYNKKYKNKKLQYKVIIIDELAQLKNDKKSMEAMEDIASMARSTGIVCIFATQRPSKTDGVITGLIKTNIPTKIGLRVDEEVDSRMIIGDDSLTFLKNKGQAVMKIDGTKEEFQTFNLDYECAKNILKKSHKEIKKYKNNNKIIKNRNNLGDFIKKEDTKSKNENKIKNINDFLKG